MEYNPGYYVEFKPVYRHDWDWERWDDIDCQNSPEAVLIKIVQIRPHQSFKKIDKNLYKYISPTGGRYHLRIQMRANNNFACLDWIPIGEEITIEKLNNKFISIDWNLGLLK